jgi:hypothetical protein
MVLRIVMVNLMGLIGTSDINVLKKTFGKLCFIIVLWSVAIFSNCFADFQICVLMISLPYTSFGASNLLVLNVDKWLYLFEYVLRINHIGDESK